MGSPINDFITETNRFYELLGPNSTNKIIIDKYNSNNKLITNSGNYIFKKIKKNNQVLNLLSDENDTTTLIITNNILKNINKKLNPNEIEIFLNNLKENSLNIIKENSKRINVKNENLITDIVKSNLTYKIRDDEKENLLEIISELISKSKLYNEIDTKKIQILKSDSIKKSQILDKLILKNSPCYMEMQTEILNPRILMTNLELTTKDIDKIIESGANVVINKKPIEITVARQLSKNNILAFENEKDMEILSKAFYKSIIISPNFIKPQNVTNIKELQIVKKNNKNYVELSGLPNTKISTVILKSQNKNTLEILELALLDTIEKINLLLKSKKIVKGSGFIEKEIGMNVNRAFLIIPKLLESKPRIIEPTLVKIKNMEIIIENLEKLLSINEIIIV